MTVIATQATEEETMITTLFRTQEADTSLLRERPLLGRIGECGRTGPGPAEAPPPSLFLFSCWSRLRFLLFPLSCDALSPAGLNQPRIPFPRVDVAPRGQPGRQRELSRKSRPRRPRARHPVARHEATAHRRLVAALRKKKSAGVAILPGRIFPRMDQCAA